MQPLFEDYKNAINKPESARTEEEKALIAKIDEIRANEIARLGEKAKQ